MTDREVLQALLAGKKLEKLRKQGHGNYIYLDGDELVDEEGKPANIYRLNKADSFVVVCEREDQEKEEEA